MLENLRDHVATTLADPTVVEELKSPRDQRSRQRGGNRPRTAVPPRATPVRVRDWSGPALQSPSGGATLAACPFAL